MRQFDALWMRPNAYTLLLVMQKINHIQLPLIILYLCGSLGAQKPMPVLTGRVLDSSERSVPEATISLTDRGHARTLTTLTQGDGSFLLDTLQEGDYQLRVSREGFGPYTQDVHVPSQASLEIHLFPGELNQSVSVSANSGYIVPISSVATRIPVNLLDVPQDVQAVSRTIIDQRLDFQLAEAARTVSGVSRTNSGSGYLGNEFAIRGFTLSTANNYLRDSLKFGIYSFSDLADVEEVNVMKGPASVLYGAAEPGGVINLVSKRPTDSPFVSLQFTGGNGDFRRPEFDISGPLLRNHVLAYRVNGSYQQDFRFRDFVKGEHYFVAPTITWRPNSDTSFTVLGELINGHATSDFGIPILGNRPAPVPVSRYYGEPFNLAEAFPRFITYSFHHSITKRWSVENRFSYWSAGSNYFEAYPTGVTADLKSVTRLLDSYRFPEKSKYSQTEIVGSFETGAIRHSVLAGFEAGWRSSYFLGANASVASQNSLRPVYGSVTREQAFLYLSDPNYPGYGNNNSVSRLQNQSGYVQDVISLGHHWKALVGGRFENYPQQSHDFLTGKVYQSADLASTPRAGLVYQPTQTTSVYFSYVRSFAPASPSSRSIDGSPFKPQHGEQYEAGVKHTALSGRASATAAVYWLKKDNVLTPNPLNPIFNIQTGAQRSKGFDIDVFGRILNGWNAWAAYAFTQAQVTEDNTYPIGNLLLNAPRHTGNVWSVYEVPRGRLEGLGVGGGLYVSSFKQGNLANSYLVPGYARVDTSIYYTFRQEKVDWRFSVNLKNALDRQHYEAGRGSFARPGATFAAYSSIKMTWH